MSFLHPEFLYLMLPPVLVLFYFILTQKEPTEQLFDSKVYTRLRVNERRLTLRQRNAIYLLISMLLIVAMAQPVIEERTVKVRMSDPTLMVALDISASMHAKDIYPSRLAVARAKLLRFLDIASHERVGVLAFGKDVYVLSPPSSDRQSVRKMVEGFAPDAYAEEGTDIMALLAAADRVMRPERERTMLLMTDGGDDRNLKAAAEFAKTHRIRLFILGTATPQGAPLIVKGEPVRRHGVLIETALNPALPELAEATGGFYLTVSTGTSDISELLGHIRVVQQRTQRGEKEVKQYGQLYILPLGLALFLLLLATSSISKRETVAVPPALIMALLCGLGSVSLRAEPFDFELLQEAKNYYHQGDYSRAANAFYRYATRKGNDPRALYDSAHALYRQGKYEPAIVLWSSIHTKERLLQFAALHNLGNAHAMIGGEEHLNAAIKAYGRALHLQNDPQTRENLEIVRGRMMRLMRAKRSGKREAATMPNMQKKPARTGAQAVSATAQAAKQKARGEAKAPGRPSETDSGAKTHMSDYEARQWMKLLQKRSGTHLYKITQKQAKGAGSVAPW